MAHDELKETFFIAGDQPDPAGTDLRGVAAGFDLTKTAIGHPMLLYRAAGRELILEADVYQTAPGQPPYVLLICPLCLMAGQKVGLQIRAGNKPFTYDPKAIVPTFPGWTPAQMRAAFPQGAGGLLNVDPFQCAHEVQPELQRAFGFAICPWKVRVDNNVVMDV